MLQNTGAAGADPGGDSGDLPPVNLRK